VEAGGPTNLMPAAADAAAPFEHEAQNGAGDSPAPFV